jgi:hypothetical protein
MLVQEALKSELISQRFQKAFLPKDLGRPHHHDNLQLYRIDHCLDQNFEMQHKG